MSVDNGNAGNFGCIVNPLLIAIPTWEAQEYSNTTILHQYKHLPFLSAWNREKDIISWG